MRCVVLWGWNFGCGGDYSSSVRMGLVRVSSELYLESWLAGWKPRVERKGTWGQCATEILATMYAAGSTSCLYGRISGSESGDWGPPICSERGEEEEEVMGISKPTLPSHSNSHTCARRVARVLVTILLVPFISLLSRT